MQSEAEMGATMQAPMTSASTIASASGPTKCWAAVFKSSSTEMNAARHCCIAVSSSTGLSKSRFIFIFSSEYFKHRVLESAKVWLEKFTRLTAVSVGGAQATKVSSG